ncbi:hypothetical protein Scep_010069 [Stephania cephalantha]|uniref:Uncharacterized protein n=1 Tax=Stephania cephalantha TaxID=152367 RepID=A0AAP0JVP7_9MAGN
MARVTRRGAPTRSGAASSTHEARRLRRDEDERSELERGARVDSGDSGEWLHWQGSASLRSTSKRTDDQQQRRQEVARSCGGDDEPAARMAGQRCGSSSGAG